MSGNDSANGTFMSAHLGGEISRRGFVKMALAAGAAALFASWGGAKALADTLSWPVPLGAMDNEIAGREILKCYAPSTVATFTEVLGLSNPSFYPNEYRDKNYADDLSKSPTLGIWGSSANDQPNCFLSNLVYRDKLGKKVDENYVAVIASALQGSTQFAVWDDEDGVPLFFKHRPDILAISPTDTWQQAEGKSNADMVKIINAFDKESEHYQDGDEKYNPSFVDFRAYYGKKLGYMYSLWDVADEADRLLAADTSRRARYTLRSVSDIAADVAHAMKKWALERDYERVFEMDADFSHAPTDLNRFLETAEDADLVLGSRYQNHRISVVNWDLRRLILSYGANVYTRIVTGLPISDATGGFKCFRREALQALNLDKMKSDGYCFQIETTFKIWKKGLRVKEIPIVFTDRTRGTSKMSGGIISEAFFLVLKLRLGLA